MFKVFLTAFWIYAIITFGLAAIVLLTIGEDEKKEADYINEFKKDPYYYAAYNKFGNFTNMCLVTVAVPIVHLVIAYLAFMIFIKGEKAKKLH